MSKFEGGQGPPPYPPPAYSHEYGIGGPGATVGPQPQTIVTTVIPLGPNSTRMICPSCHVEITTSTITKPGIIAFISGFVIAMLGCFCGCCFIPCCFNDCMDVHHNCPNCGSYLGRFRR